MAQMKQTKFFNDEDKIFEAIPNKFFRYCNLINNFKNKDLLFFELCNKYGMLFLNNSLEFEIKKTDIEYFNAYIKEIEKDIYISKKVFNKLLRELEIYEQKQLFKNRNCVDSWKTTDFYLYLEKKRLLDFYFVYYNREDGKINNLGLNLFNMKYMKYFRF